MEGDVVEKAQGFLADEEVDDLERWARHGLRGNLGLQPAARILRLIEEVRTRRSPAKADVAAVPGASEDH